MHKPHLCQCVCKFTSEHFFFCTRLSTKYYKHGSKPLQSSCQVCWEICILKLNGYLCKSYLIRSKVQINSSLNDKGLKILRQQWGPISLKVAGAWIWHHPVSEPRHFRVTISWWFHTSGEVNRWTVVCMWNTLFFFTMTESLLRNLENVTPYSRIITPNRRKKILKDILYILNYCPLNSVFTYPY
jgi:hypothetical protein